MRRTSVPQGISPVGEDLTGPAVHRTSSTGRRARRHRTPSRRRHRVVRRRTARAPSGARCALNSANNESRSVTWKAQPSCVGSPPFFCESHLDLVAGEHGRVVRRVAARPDSKAEHRLVERQRHGKVLHRKMHLVGLVAKRLLERSLHAGLLRDRPRDSRPIAAENQTVLLQASRGR